MNNYDKIMDSEYVLLKCVKDHGKLRIRILTSGYYTYANCQFPKDIRKENRYYKVKKSSVKLVTRTNKWYYKVGDRKSIIIIDNYDEDKMNKEIIKSISIFEDASTDECCICFDNKKDIVFTPCGHFYCCSHCSKAVSSCPICRCKIDSRINKALFD